MAKRNGAMVGMDKDWRAESDMRTLIDAEKIKKDKPRYMAACRKAKEQIKANEAVIAGKKQGSY